MIRPTCDEDISDDMAGACDVNQASQSKSTKPSHTALPPGKDFIKDLFAFSSSQRLSQNFHIPPPSQNTMLPLLANLYGGRSNMSFQKTRPYICSDPECGASYTRREHLIRHEAQHSNAQAHVCKVCGLGFSRRYSLYI